MFGFNRRPPSPNEVSFFHEGDDVDQHDGSHHHTLGEKAGQAARGQDLARLRADVEELGEAVDEATAATEDSGWIAVSSFSNSFSSDTSGNSNVVAYRKIGKVIYLGGGLLRGSGTGSVFVTAFTLPVGFRPAKPVSVMNLANGINNFAGIKIGVDGTVSVWLNAVFSATPGAILGGISFPVAL